MEKVRSDLAKGGIEGLTIDEGFLDAVGQMPRCAGVSVGMDRLAMIALDAKDISQVVYPFKGVTT
jgi:lysyl-tRNA synthetase class 2